MRLTGRKIIVDTTAAIRHGGIARFFRKDPQKSRADYPAAWRRIVMAKNTGGSRTGPEVKSEASSGSVARPSMMTETFGNKCD
jgi:S-adenosylmethionine synthetase